MPLYRSTRGKTPSAFQFFLKPRGCSTAGENKLGLKSIGFGCRRRILPLFIFNFQHAISLAHLRGMAPQKEGGGEWRFYVPKGFPSGMGKQKSPDHLPEAARTSNNRHSPSNFPQGNAEALLGNEKRRPTPCSFPEDPNSNAQHHAGEKANRKKKGGGPGLATPGKPTAARKNMAKATANNHHGNGK